MQLGGKLSEKWWKLILGHLALFNRNLAFLGSSSALTWRSAIRLGFQQTKIQTPAQPDRLIKNRSMCPRTPHHMTPGFANLEVLQSPQVRFIKPFQHAIGNTYHRSDSIRYMIGAGTRQPPDPATIWGRTQYFTAACGTSSGLCCTDAKPALICPRKITNGSNVH
jgi:hypothetical protein